MLASSKVSEEDIKMILEMLSRPMTQTAVARELGVSITLINRIAKRTERGEPVRKSRIQLSDNLFAHCDQSGGKDSCWEWTKARCSDGYGSVWVNKKSESAHRLAYTLAVGPIGTDENGDTLCVRHLCDNPPCINPSHLIMGTIHDNVLDREERARGYRPIGENSPRSVLTTKDAIFIKRCRDIYSSTEMAEMLGVGSSAVRRVLDGTTWGHIQDDLPLGAAAVSRHAA